MSNAGMKSVMRGRSFEAIDAIGRAFEREREARFWPVWQPDFVVLRPSSFRCVCCLKLRSTEQRREPESEVCMKCESCGVRELNH